MKLFWWKVALLLTSFAIFLNGTVPIIGYAIGQEGLFNPFAAVGMAPFTAIGFILCGLMGLVIFRILLSMNGAINGKANKVLYEPVAGFSTGGVSQEEK